MCGTYSLSLGYPLPRWQIQMTEFAHMGFEFMWQFGIYTSREETVFLAPQFVGSERWVGVKKEKICSLYAFDVQCCAVCIHHSCILLLHYHRHRCLQKEERETKKKKRKQYAI